MALEGMFPAVNNSVATRVVSLVSASETGIDLENAAYLPEGPNLATFGEADSAELVYYARNEGNRLSGCRRGFGGTVAAVWPAGTPVYRAYTAHDHGLFIRNILALDAGKADVGSDGGGTPVSFGTAGSRVNVESGETLAVLMGKLRRWFVDLGGAAWLAVGSNAGTVAAGDHGHAQYVSLDAEGKVPAAAVAARGVDVLAGRALRLDDAGKCLYVASASAVTVTIPADAAVDFPVDTEIEIAWEGAGRVRVGVAAGVTLYGVKGSLAGGVDLATRFAVCVLKKRAAGSWRITGELA